MGSGSESGGRGRPGHGLEQPGEDRESREGPAQHGRDAAPERHVREGRWPAEGERRGGEPDVLLDVPDLRVESIRLAVDGLDVDLSLRARLANLIQLDAGVHVRLDAVELDISGVQAEALLKVRLERLAEILDRALETIDQNPQVIESVARNATGAASDVGRAAQRISGSSERLGGMVDRLGRDIGSVTARAEWSGPGAIAKGGEQPGGQAQPGGGRQQPGEQKAGQPAGGQPQAGQPAGGGQKGGQQQAGQQEGGGPGWPMPNPADLAGQAGEVLRQAGRSVWDVIRAGMTQHGPQSKG
ncbi:hypothetical protein [Micromonospora costi]|uniref:hypothetical protein n=1 Tax=Micromonospora costi TaxID=1530042 RepID=UPI00131A2DA8|nr:hypothetical protein [Micromonospora costi]